MNKNYLKKNFSNYQNYDDSNEAFNDLTHKIMNFIDKVAPTKKNWLKQKSQEWFDWQIVNKIINQLFDQCDQLFQKFKKSKLHIDRNIYDAERYKLHKVIIN